MGYGCLKFFNICLVMSCYITNHLKTLWLQPPPPCMLLMNVQTAQVWPQLGARRPGAGLLGGWCTPAWDAGAGCEPGTSPHQGFPRHGTGSQGQAHACLFSPSCTHHTVSGPPLAPICQEQVPKPSPHLEAGSQALASDSRWQNHPGGF